MPHRTLPAAWAKWTWRWCDPCGPTLVMECARGVCLLPAFAEEHDGVERGAGVCAEAEVHLRIAPRKALRRMCAVPGIGFRENSGMALIGL